MENSHLERLIGRLLQEEHLISEKRKSLLRLTADLIDQGREKYGKAKVIFICTHNSRRSQLAEAWLVAAKQYFKEKNIRSYSGGTEATSFNIRMVVALREAYFHLHSEGSAVNPKYKLLALKEPRLPHFMFSKVYDDEFNPQKDFIALMVCSDADENCPLVRGSDHRISLPYDDPKEFDDTPMEAGAYSDKVREIGREMVYLISQISKSQTS